jgi:hypothetical protein
VNDCALFACAYITLLASGLDPSQYTFDQGSPILIPYTSPVLGSFLGILNNNLNSCVF